MFWIQEVDGGWGQEWRMVPRFYVPVVLKFLGNGGDREKRMNSLG